MLLLTRPAPPVAPPGTPRLVATGDETTFAFPVKRDSIDLVLIRGINFGLVPVGPDVLSAAGTRKNTGGVLCGRSMRSMGCRLGRACTTV